MSDTLTRPDAGVLLDTEESEQLGNSECAHIVKEENGNGAAKVMESRVYGTPLEALCGYVWVAQKNPDSLSVCEKCKEIFEMERMFDDDLNGIDDMNRG